MPAPIPPNPPHGPPPETLKDTLISIMIAFTMAFVFRGFVVEAFVIPTGSMAPTLMGAHTQWRGPNSGYAWPVGATVPLANDQNSYVDPQPNVQVQDPISGEVFPARNRRTFSGDRILVLKYLYALRDPKRFDVIVFKNPQNPADNYIKRLIGLPGEQIALADGDIFFRTVPEGREPAGDSYVHRAQLWETAGWKIARKDPITQRAVWQTVHDSAFAPLASSQSGPWAPSEQKDWTLGPREYQYTGSAAVDLVFDQTRRRTGPEARGPLALSWVIDDYYPYNEPMYARLGPRFPVSDIRMHAAFKPASEGQSIGIDLATHAHQFRATLTGGKAEIAWRQSVGAVGTYGPWQTVATASAPALPAGVVSNVEFWHLDQSLQVWLNGKRIVEFQYDWSPGQRILYATGRSLEGLMNDQSGIPKAHNILANPNLYTQAGCNARFTFSGGPFTLTRVGLDRDLFYQPASKDGGKGPPGLATSPYAPLILSPDQFFACGDNSPASADGRLWDSVDPWVNEQFPIPAGPYQRAGVIPRDLLLGKAFFVYWPSLKYEGDPVPVPDFGRMRFIW